MLTLEILKLDQSENAVAADDRDGDQRFAQVCAGKYGVIEFSIIRRGVENDRLMRFLHHFKFSTGQRRDGRYGDLLTVLTQVKIVHKVGFGVIPTDHQVGRVKDGTQFIADQVDDRLKVQLGSQTALDGINDLQLGDTFLLGFKEPRVLDGNAHVRRQGLQQAFMILIKRILFVTAYHDHTDHFFARNDRYQQGGLRNLA